MKSITFSPTAAGWQSEPLTATAANMVIHLEFTSPVRVTLQHSITGSSFVPCDISDPLKEYEKTLTGLVAGQQVRIQTDIKPTLAQYLE